MKVFVISLSNSHERRQCATAQMRSAGIRFEFFDAIRGDVAIRDCIFEAFDEAAYMLNTGRHAVIGELGCFASHRELWVQCVERNEPIVVMEDDFNLLPQFTDALRAAEKVVSDVGFIRLQTILRAKHTEVATVDGFSLGRFTKAPHGTMSYCISPDVAKRFLHITRTITAPVDVFLKKYWEHGQPLYALSPFTVAPSVLSVDSTIVGRNKTNKTWRVRRQRFLRKTGWYLQRWAFNWRMSLRSRPDTNYSNHRDDIQLRTSETRLSSAANVTPRPSTAQSARRRQALN